MFTEPRYQAASWLLKFGVPFELDKEIRALNQPGKLWNRLRKVIQDRRQEGATVLLDNELPFFSALAPAVIRIIIDCMVTPELVTLEEVGSGSG